MIYEAFRSGFDDSFHVHYESRFTFPMHIHRSYEIIVSLDKSLYVTVNSKEYELKKNDALIVFPYQRHSYRHTDEHKTLVFIFSPGCVPYFHRMTENKYPSGQTFSIENSSVARMLGGINRENFKEFQSEFEDRFAIRGILYTLLSHFMKQNELVQGGAQIEGMLIERMLSLVDSLDICEVSLNKISEKLGYDYYYLSKYFKKILGVSFTSYVNQYRVHKACQILQSEKCKMIDVAMRVGYNNLRSFNSNFKKVTGITPLQYVSGKKPDWSKVGTIIVK